MTIKLYKCVKLLVLFFCIGLSSPMHPRAINLAIESAFYLDPKDVEDNSSLLDKVKDFIDKLQYTIDPKKANARRAMPKDKLTEFLTELGILVMNFDDNEFSELANDLKGVVDNKSKTPEFNKAIQDENVKLFLKISVNEWTKEDPTKLKLEIARYVTNRETTAFVTFFRNLNKYYKETDEKVLKEIVEEFKEAKKDKDFTDVLNKAVEFIVFDKLIRGDEETLMNLNNDVKELSENVKNKVKDYVKDKVKDAFSSDVETKDSNVKTYIEKSLDKQAATEGTEIDEDVQHLFEHVEETKKETF